jgi:hypothetical protein
VDKTSKDELLLTDCSNGTMDSLSCTDRARWKRKTLVNSCSRSVCDVAPSVSARSSYFWPYADTRWAQLHARPPLVVGQVDPCRNTG